MKVAAAIYTVFVFMAQTVGQGVAGVPYEADQVGTFAMARSQPGVSVWDKRRAITRASRDKQRAAVPTASPPLIATTPRSSTERNGAATQRSNGPVVRGSAWVERVRLCIRAHESHGNYRALNRSSGASGAYQFMDATWHGVTGLTGKAMDYPPSVQDAAFYKLFNNGKGARNWVTYPLCA